MNIHDEYANVLICICEDQIKGRCLRLDLVPTVLLSVEHRLRHE